MEQYLTLAMALRCARDEPRRRLGSSFGSGKSPIKAETEDRRSHEENMLNSGLLEELNQMCRPSLSFCTCLHPGHRRSLSFCTCLHQGEGLCGNKTSAASSPKPEAQCLAELGWIPWNLLQLANATFCFALLNSPWVQVDRTGLGTGLRGTAFASTSKTLGPVLSTAQPGLLRALSTDSHRHPLYLAVSSRGLEHE